MREHPFTTFVLRTLVALLPVLLFVGLYLVIDPFRVVHRYDGISIAAGDTLERMPNKRYVAIEGLRHYDPEHHFDSFIFGSSISSNFTVAAWKRHLPDSASVYHFTAGAETLSGIRDELRYLFEGGYTVRHVMLVMEAEMFHRPTRYEEMPFVPHYDVSPAISWLHFHRLHFNAFRDPYMFLYQLHPTRWLANKLLEDGKMTTVPSGRDEVTNEDSSYGLDTLIANNGDRYYQERIPWLIDMQPQPNPMPLDIDETNSGVLREIAAMLRDHGVDDYIVIVPPRFRSQPLSPIDHMALCEIMGQQHVNDFSADSVLIHDLHSYYDGVHILTHRCTEMIDRCYNKAPQSTLITTTRNQEPRTKN